VLLASPQVLANPHDSWFCAMSYKLPSYSADCNLYGLACHPLRRLPECWYLCNTCGTIRCTTCHVPIPPATWAVQGAQPVVTTAAGICWQAPSCAAQPAVQAPPPAWPCTQPAPCCTALGRRHVWRHRH
jgi:hypothetical protein